MLLVENGFFGESEQSETDDWDVDPSSSKKPAAKKKKRKNSQSAPTDYDFTLEEMSPPFHSSIRTMLTADPLFSFKAAVIADTVVEQASVGTVVTQPEDGGEDGQEEAKKAKKVKKVRKRETGFVCSFSSFCLPRFCLFVFLRLSEP